TEDTEDTTTEGGETTETEGTEASGGDVTEFLRSQLAGAGIPKDQVDCVVDELESTLGEDELEQLQTATTASQEVIDASTAAAQKCLAP
ncbi:MAG TPA: hypothetical protein VHF58_09095, partial [Solirubrobacterales bacterium]|nr:hypothetical protein [Solirubrobacterales bacterium]